LFLFLIIIVAENKQTNVWKSGDIGTVITIVLDEAFEDKSPMGITIAILGCITFILIIVTTALSLKKKKKYSYCLIGPMQSINDKGFT